MTKWATWSRRAPVRVVRALVLVLAATWALYLVIVHLVLWTPLLRNATNSSLSVKIGYESAWSVWPGRVHLRGVRVRIHEETVDALISIDRAVASFDLPAVLGRQMTVHDLQASGVSVQVRPRYQPGELGPDTLEGQPEIPGLPDTRVDAQPPPPVTDENYDLFTVDLQHVIADPVREVWIGPYRYSGDARVEGSMYLRPERKLAIGPARADVRSGELVLAKRPFGQQVKGTVTCTVPMTNIRSITDQELIRRFDVVLDLGSEVEDFSFMQRFLAHAIELRVEAGAGHAKGRLHVRDGVIQDGSAFELHSKRLLVHHPRAQGVTDLALGLAVERGEAKGSATLSHTKISARWAENWPVRIESMSLAARSRSLDLSNKPFDDLSASADAPAIAIPDLRILRLWERDVAIGKGSATLAVHGDLDVPKKKLTGDASLSAPHVEGSYEGVGIAGAVKASGKQAKLDLVTMKGSVPSLKIELTNVNVRAEGGKKPPPTWWGRIEARELIFDREHLIAELSAKLRDARPIMYVFAAKKDLPEWTRGFLDMEGLEATAHFETGPERIEVDRLEAKASPWEVGGHWKQIGARREGELYLGNGVLGVKVPLDTGGGSAKPAIGGGPKGSQ
ncbi:MAG: hypothetical protein ACXVEF_21150 [Polyangiales bacterium]